MAQENGGEERDGKLTGSARMTEVRKDNIDWDTEIA
jgi:hypothetical protein